jgi:signal transduction histidine kinase
MMNRIDVKLGVTIILLFLIILLPLGFVIDQIFSGFYYKKVQEETQQLSQNYAEIIAENRNPMTFHMMGMMARFSHTTLFIIDEQGVIIVNSGVEGLPIGSKIPPHELLALKEGTLINNQFEDPVLRKHYLLSATPVIDHNSFYGAVYVLASIEGIYQSVEKLRYLLLLSGIGAFFLVLGFTLLLSRKLSFPLIELTKATRKISTGDYEARVSVTSKDEIGSLAQAINDLAVDLKRYKDSRSEFFANISHELRTPMTYLEGYTKVLQEGLYQSDEEKNQYLTIVHQEAVRLKLLIHDLFELSKMEEGKVPLQPEWIDVTEVVDQVLLKTKMKAKEKGLTFQLDIGEDIPLIFADGHRIEQVLYNLIDNAIRYTEQGTISVSLSQSLTDSVSIHIKDSGIGIPESEIPYIFERFYRVEKSRAREFGGTGLGLAIVKKLIELHGGKVKVTSQSGEGTTFSITLPIEALGIQGVDES